jgi:squalene-hopene/tetraprenyl-beta-curcumene cyclase
VNSYRGRLVAVRVAYAVVILCGTTAHAGDPSRPPWEARAAAKYLDERAAWWLNWTSSARGAGTSCVACHTGMPFALARPALREFLGEALPGEFESRIMDGVIKRVANWDAVTSETGLKAFYSGDRKSSALGTEAVINALVLVNYDARRNGGTLSERANQALDHLWARQQDRGSWPWLNFGLKPWETGDEYYGAALAAIATGMAGNAYHRSGEVQAKVEMLRQYLKREFAGQSLHNRIMALWASTELKGVLRVEDEKKLILEVFDAQTVDGGWNLADLGPNGLGPLKWKAQGEYPPGVKGDGYATGLVVYVLVRAGVATTDAKVQAGRQWLFTNQDREAGTWPAIYLNKNRDASSPEGKFMRDAATGFAALALTAAK